MRMIPVLLCAAILSGCGDDGGGNPAAPSSNVSSIAIVLSPALKIGQTEQATATATLTGGGTQSISSGFRSDTPYQGEDLVFESNAPEHFLARCSQKGVTNSGTCLLERRIGSADVTLRFPRDWLDNWSDVAGGIDRLIARLHPEDK